MTHGILLEEGQRIILKPDGLESITATVRWASEEFAGVEFDHALHPAIVEHLCQLHPDLEKSAPVELTLAASGGARWGGNR